MSIYICIISPYLSHKICTQQHITLAPHTTFLNYSWCIQPTVENVTWYFNTVHTPTKLIAFYNTLVTPTYPPPPKKSLPKQVVYNLTTTYSLHTMIIEHTSSIHHLNKAYLTTSSHYPKQYTWKRTIGTKKHPINLCI